VAEQDAVRERPGATTRVRLISRASGHNSRGNPPGGASNVVGQFIEIALPPVEPDHNWTCGTPYVWAVTDDQLAAINVRPGYFGHIFVCVHQIEID